MHTTIADPRIDGRYTSRHTALGVKSFGLTDRGLRRNANEDQFAIVELLKTLHVQSTSLPESEIKRCHDRRHLFIVADGMGGRAAGETASALAVDSVEAFVLDSLNWFARCKGEEHDLVLIEFKKALRQASDRVDAEAAAHPELEGMGTTLTLAYSLNDELFVAHAGDSRCYLFREKSLHRLTRDHTLVNDLVRLGHISPEAAEQHKLRHVITNVLGGGCPKTEVEVHKLDLESGDLVLLCTDGLTEMLSDDQISQILQDAADAEQACRQLVDDANTAGGKDNVTVVVAQFEAPSDPA
ncbi:MAG: serine/threonine-protein phosphatase [Planctomycetia bacterium]|nr:serine/threonine-protein phosphatase [Planctomycetia bacterium]